MPSDNHRLIPDPVWLENLQAWRALSHEEQQRRIRGDQARYPKATGSRIRIGLLCPCLVIGGGESWQSTLIRLLNKFEWVGACVVDLDGPADPAMVKATRAALPLHFGRDAARQLAASVDVLIAWGIEDLASLLPTDDDGPAVIVVSHMPGESDWGRGVCSRLERVDRIVAVSELAVSAFPAARQSEVHVIWNTVDPDRLVIKRGREVTRTRWGVPIDAPVVGYLGRLSGEKDPHAMLRLGESLPAHWHTVLVGDGRDKPGLSLLATDSIAAGRIHLVGPDREIGDVMSAFDYLIVPSHYEASGLSLAEGCWAGVPVISTSVGIARLHPGLTREIPDSADGATLAAAVLADEADQAGTKIRVASARSFVQDRMGPARFARDWESLIAELRMPEMISSSQKIFQATDPVVLAGVAACPSRGGVLPLSMQICDCRGRELSSCAAGKGHISGRVSFLDCRQCVAARLNSELELS